MTEQIELKYRRLMNGRPSLENELSVVHSRKTESLEGPIRKTKINAIIESCKSILENALAKNDELEILANETDKPSKLITELAAWWDRIVKVNDEVTGKARLTWNLIKLQRSASVKLVDQQFHQNWQNPGRVSKAQ